MSVSNKGPGVNPLLQNLTNALYLNQGGDVTVRTGFTGNIVISGNVNIPGEVTVISDEEHPLYVQNHIIAVGTSSEPLTTPWLPVSLDGNANVSITSLPAITGHVTVDNFPAFPSNVRITDMPAITGSVGVTGNVSITQMPGISGNVHIYGNIGGSDQPITVNQGTTPWTVSGDITGNVISTPYPGIGDYYGEPYAISITPQMQFTGYDGIRALDTQTYTAGGGSVISDTDMGFQIACTSTVGSYAVFRSRRFNNFRAGQTNLARFLAKFDTAKATTQQMVGIQNQESAYYVGYNGTQFGFQHQRTGRATIYTLKVNSFTGTQTVTLTLNSVTYTISLTSGQSVQQAAQLISQTNWNGIWLASQIGDTVYLLSGGANGPMNGTFSVSSSGNLNATLTCVQTGVTNVAEWVYPGTGNFPALPSWLDPSTYNKWQFKYGYAGVRVFALNPSTNIFVQIYAHSFNNDGSMPVRSANFKIAGVAYNIGGSNAVTLSIADMMGGLEGIANSTVYPHSASVTQTSLTQNTVQHIMSLHNPYIFQSRINMRETLLRDLTVAVQCNDPVEFRVYIDAPLSAGIYDFQPQDGFLVGVATNTGTVNTTNSWPMLSQVVGTTGSSIQFNLADYFIIVPPGATLTLAAYSTATIQKCSVALCWSNA